jgi:serine phosphatase RsbU (regulator of sigma subunit)
MSVSQASGAASLRSFAPPRRDLRILFVQDDERDGAIAGEDLSGLEGARILRCATLHEALPRLNAVDCVLLDLGLRGGDGLDSIARLHAHAPATPIVALVPVGNEAVGAAAVGVGAEDYLVTEHLRGGDLARAIRYALGTRQIASVESERDRADSRSDEALRMERGLVPAPIMRDRAVWSTSRYSAGRSRALLGGDFLDLLQAEDGGIHAVMGDVCGHGPDEAAVGVSLRAAWRALALSGHGLSPMLATLEHLLVAEHTHAPSLFVTICALRIDPVLRTVSVALAGHPPPLLVDGHATRRLGVGDGGRALGIGSAPRKVETVMLPEDWAILLYTDGIIEARVGGGPERLGELGLRRAIDAIVREEPGWRHAPRELLERVLHRAEHANAGPLADDVAMLLVGARVADGADGYR